MGKKKIYSIEYAMEKAKELDITLLATEYHGWSASMDFICNKHPELGVGQTSMRSLEFGQCSCKKCQSERKRVSQIHISIDDIGAEFKERNLTLLSTEYINCKQTLEYICDIHPEDGVQYITYDAFKNATKFCCNSCAKQHISDLKRLPEDQIRQIVESKGFIYVGYFMKGRRVQIRCICKKHQDKGEQIKELYSFTHNIGCGCVYCQGSNPEQIISNLLDYYNIDYKREYTFDDLSGEIKKLRFDFAIFKQGILYCLLEYDGEFHYDIDAYSRRYGTEEALYKFERCKKYDELKDKYCEGNHITLIRIPYTELKNIESILIDALDLDEEKVG